MPCEQVRPALQSLSVLHVHPRPRHMGGVTVTVAFAVADLPCPEQVIE